MEKSSRNVFGQPLKECSSKPLTGFYRDGCCKTGKQDFGRHLVCAIMTDDFLDFSMRMGNPLKTPMPQYNFPGLKAGDKWCLCAMRWKEAHEAGVAPKVDLEATNEKVLELVEMDLLIKYAQKKTT